jgi:hypothetical protein
MGAFGRQVRRAFAFGRQLQRGADVFGRQLSNSARDVSRGIGTAQRFVSRIEKAVPDSIPVLDAGLKAVSSGLKAGQNVSQLAGVGGAAIRNAAAGNLRGLADNQDQGSALLGQLGGNVTSAVASGGAAMAQGAAFI